MANQQLRDKVAIVTGAASGIGLATAELFIERGARVLLTDINEADGEEAAGRLGRAAAFRRQDVVSESDWQAVIDDCKTRFGTIDALVNNAGIVFRDGQLTPESMTLEEWRNVNRINMDSVMLGCRYAIAAMKESGGGSIVNMASVGGVFASPLAMPYGAGKAAIIQLTRTIAFYCARQGYSIRCNAVLPGTIETALYQSFSDEQRAANTASIPYGRPGAAREVAQAVAFLVSDDASYVTGIQLPVDGGLTSTNPMRAASGGNDEKDP